MRLVVQAQGKQKLSKLADQILSWAQSIMDGTNDGASELILEAKLEGMNKLVSIAEISISDLVKHFEATGLPLKVETDENDVFFNSTPSFAAPSSPNAWTLTRVGYATALDVRVYSSMIDMCH